MKTLIFAFSLTCSTLIAQDTVIPKEPIREFVTASIYDKDGNHIKTFMASNTDEYKDLIPGKYEVVLTLSLASGIEKEKRFWYTVYPAPTNKIRVDTLTIEP